MIAAPIFSTEYQTGADSILRCTKYGRTRLAVTKIISALLISVFCFLICMSAWILMTNFLFGWESVKTSVQMLFSITSLVPWNIGQLQWQVVLVSLLSLLATVSAILFVSSRCRNQMVSMVLALFICILPLFLTNSLPDVLGNWYHCIWPTGGIGFQNSILYDFTEFNYLSFGTKAMWIPCGIILFALIEIPIFIGLTIQSYNKHTV